ncbi:helix-turn-helix domain-containing protein [Mucispirillum schaedleri]|uniref:helix-turn-helix domain-containing protein n=1 Tax=Mucispirillum schaedleri TaxID=248039 RepID=UPI001F563B74|nr:helix-turn-helix transcriptional regulator [Mucispirillum schaedleri]
MKKSLGSILAELRKQNNMTQADVAEKMCVTDKAVSKWERDISCPNIETIQKLADFFNIPVNELLSAKSSSENIKKNNIITLIFNAAALAMGISVLVLMIMDSIDIKNAVIMLAAGLGALSINLLKSK